MIDVKQSKLTSNFLTSISNRLCTRSELKNTEYIVDIGDNYIHMDPVVYVFPDTHHRKETDKRLVLDYLINTIFTQLSCEYKIVNDCIRIQPDKLVTGKYIYKYYPHNNKRRWMKLFDTDDTKG